MSQQFIDEFQNNGCAVCNVKRPFTAWLRIKPASFQSLAKEKMTKSFRVAVAAFISDCGMQMAVSHSSRTPLNVIDGSNRNVCIGLFLGLSAVEKDKDVDNVSKAFLDALKGNLGLISDDACITHLDIRKVVMQTSIPSSSNHVVGIRLGVLPAASGSINYQLANIADWPELTW